MFGKVSKHHLLMARIKLKCYIFCIIRQNRVHRCMRKKFTGILLMPIR